jgi:hypothetical protein
LWNQDHYTRIERRRLDSGSLTFLYLFFFYHNWRYKSNFDVIGLIYSLVVLEHIFYYDKFILILTNLG